MNDELISVWPTASSGELVDFGRLENRAVCPANSLGVDNDHDAVLVWLGVIAKNPATRRAYLFEAQRFIAFLHFIRRQSISTATVGDLEAFRVWLVAPYFLDCSAWPDGYMPFKTVGGDDRSPPLPKGLSLSSRKRADNTIKGMYRYLHGAGYLAQNPAFLLSGLTGAEVSQDDLERIGVSPERYVRRLKQQAIANDNRAESKALSADLWVWLCEFLDASENTWRIPEIPSSPLPSTANPAWKLERRERLRCIMLFGHASASRRSELTDSMMSSVVLSDRRWVWKVLGKGRNPSESPDRVVLTKTAINALGRYRLVRGLPEFPSAAEESEPLIAKLTPVRPRQHGIGSLKTGRGVTAGYLNTELQRFLSFAAGFVPEGRERWAVQLRTAASHSLRHTCGTHYALAGLSMDDAAKHLRHKDPRTTAKHYTHLTDDERGQSVDAMERLLSGKRKNQPPDA